MDFSMVEGEELKFFIRRIDNELKIYVNGSVVYNKGMHGAPPLSEVVDLTNRLAIGTNNITVELTNWPQANGNPWSLAYQLKLGNAVKQDIDENSPGSTDPMGGIRWRDEIIVRVAKR